MRLIRHDDPEKQILRWTLEVDWHDEMIRASFSEFDLTILEEARRNPGCISKQLLALEALAVRIEQGNVITPVGHCGRHDDEIMDTIDQHWAD